jgi:hypothetical protein
MSRVRRVKRVLKIIIELWPNGNEAKKKVVAEGIIANNGSGNNTYGNYCYALRRGQTTPKPSYIEVLVGEGDIEGHYRPENAWELLRKVLKHWDRSPNKDVRRCDDGD